MKITTNGLDNPEFDKIRISLYKDVIGLLKITQSGEGHLADIVSGIKTIQSSMDIKTKKLWKIFEEQKTTK